jgi:hypothetical protein
LEIVDFSVGILVDTAANVTASHVVFRKCNTGIENSFGTMKLTAATFIDTAFPGQISVQAVFDHSDTTFSGTGFKGWNYAGDVRDEVHLKSRDGEYYVFGLRVIQGGSLYFNFGTTAYIQDGFPIQVFEHGNLFISGTELSPVTIYGNGDCPLKMPAISAASQSTVTITHANFHDLCTGIDATNVTIDIGNSVFKNISGTAIKLKEEGDITVTHTDISDSGIAIELDGPTIQNISQNHFHGNAVGVSLKDTYTAAIIKNNGWGSDSGPTIADNPDGTGDSIVLDTVPEVIYRPWLEMEDEQPPVDTPTDPADEPPVAAEPGDHDPIIIVPGITGSILNKDYDDHGELWPNLTKLIANIADSQLDDLALLQSGIPSTVRPIAVGDIIRKISSVDIFDSLITVLNHAGYVEGTNLFVLPYDWRFSNAENQKLLKDMVATALEKSGKTKVNIIAHSMGGLLVKDYVAENPSVPVDHIFNIAVPHLGAPKTFKTLMYGDDMGFTFSLTSAIKVPVLNESRVKAITQNMPSVYELLPGKKYIDLFGPYIDDRIQDTVMDIDGVERFMVADGRNEKMFPFAKALHDRIDTMPATIPTYNFIGCGSTKTVSSIVLTKEQSLTLTGFKLVPEHRIVYGAGDGVVPIGSAGAVDGAQNYYVTAGSHGTMPSLPAIQNAILAVLGGGTITSDSGISNAVGLCKLSGDIVEVHSPVSLDIYDQDNRHTGLAADGETEYGIPGVQYEMIDNEKFAFMPSGAHYRVVTRAQSTGAYDMYITHTDDTDVVTHQSYYHAVPLVTENSTGTIMLADETVSPMISIDDNDDTVTDRTVTASSSLESDKVNDHTPPVTTAAFDGTMVTLSATDDISGVLNTKYSTDNVVWNVYSNPFKAKVGVTVYFVSLDAAGNTEDIKQIQTAIASMVSGGGSVSAPTLPADTSAPVVSEEPAIEKPNDDTVSIVLDKKADIAAPSATFLVAPAPDEGTVMSDNEITKSTLLASVAAVASAGTGAIKIIGAITVVGIGLFLIFSKKRG